MAYLTMSDLGQQSRQQGFWDWFFGGGAKPKKPYKEAAFKQQQSGKTFAPSKKWGGMEFEAEAAEDLDAFKAQGYDAAQALGRLADVSQWGVGLSDDPPPAPPAPVAASTPAPQSARKPDAGVSSVRLAAAALGLGGALAMAYHFATSKPDVRSNGRRRN